MTALDLISAALLLLALAALLLLALAAQAAGANEARNLQPKDTM